MPEALASESVPGCSSALSAGGTPRRRGHSGV